jgi:Mrp family chromosome partitioning ATPase
MANTEKAPYLPKMSPAPGSVIKHAVAVMSGKGGVGKSFTSSFLAVKLARLGYKVGILDADITGPSIPFAFNVHGPVESTSQQYFYPLKTKTGIQIMSSNLLVANPEDPIVWRGPMIGSLCQQFYTDVIWDVDFLLIDMAPGTGDVSLTVFQNVPLSSAVLVASPQNLVSLIVEKSANMADMLSVPIISLVENMAYVKCPHCGERIDIYGKANPTLAKEHGIPHFDEIPFDSLISEAMDKGAIEDLDVPYLDETVNAIVAAAKADDEMREKAYQELARQAENE